MRGGGGWRWGAVAVRQAVCCPALELPRRTAQHSTAQHSTAQRPSPVPLTSAAPRSHPAAPGPPDPPQHHRLPEQWASPAPARRACPAAPAPAHGAEEVGQSSASVAYWRQQLRQQQQWQQQRQLQLQWQQRQQTLQRQQPQPHTLSLACSVSPSVSRVTSRLHSSICSHSRAGQGRAGQGSRWHGRHGLRC